MMLSTPSSWATCFPAASDDGPIRRAVIGFPSFFAAVNVDNDAGVTFDPDVSRSARVELNLEVETSFLRDNVLLVRNLEDLANIAMCEVIRFFYTQTVICFTEFKVIDSGTRNDFFQSLIIK